MTSFKNLFLFLFFWQQAFFCCQTGEPVIDNAQITINKLHFHNLPISRRVYSFLWVRDIGIIEGPNNMNQSIGLRHKRKKGITKALSFAGIFRESRQVYKFHCSWRLFFRLKDLHKVIKPQIWNWNHGTVRICFSTGVGLNLRSSSSNNVKNRAFPAKRQPDYSTL